MQWELKKVLREILSDGSLATRKEAERRKREAEIIKQKFEEYQNKKNEEEQKCEIYNFFANSSLKKKSLNSKKKKKSSNSPKKKSKSSKSPKKNKSNSKKSKKSKNKKKSPKKSSKSSKKSKNSKDQKNIKIKDKENVNLNKQQQQKNNIQKLMDKERDLHQITDTDDQNDFYIQSIENFDDSVLSADQEEIKNFMGAYEERQKYEITNNKINEILKDINIDDLDINEEIESIFQRKSNINIKQSKVEKQFQIQQDDKDYNKYQNSCKLKSFQEL